MSTFGPVDADALPLTLLQRFDVFRQFLDFSAGCDRSITSHNCFSFNILRHLFSNLVAQGTERKGATV
jgi:hypothetical protein